MNKRATFYGLCAILMWSTLIAVVRSVTEAFGVELGLALMFTVGAIALCIRQGLPDIRKIPKVYLFGCGFLYVFYEILLSNAIGLATSSRQTMEVGMINYLWPCCIIVFSIWINKQKFNLWLWPGIALLILGIYWCIGSDGGMDIVSFASNLASSPIPYTLAFIGAIFWGLYCNISKRYSQGNNAMPLFFVAISLLMWLRYLIGHVEVKEVSLWGIAQLIFIGIVFAASYSFWEIGMQKGNMVVLAILSNFTPVFSMLFICLWLHTMPAPSFWIGVVMVSLGSLLCWQATRNKVSQITSKNK